MAEIPEFSLGGMTAVVTGGGRSIGRGTAVALAQAARMSWWPAGTAAPWTQSRRKSAG